MRQSAKIMVAVATVLVIVGAAAFIIVMAANKWKTDSIISTKMNSRTVEITESFKDISINTDTDKITFLSSDDGKCTLVFTESEKEKHTAEVAGGVLTIGKTDTRNWYDHVTFFSGAPSVTVYLPRADHGALTIEESTGDVDIPGDFTFESIDITASTGDVKCRASSGGSVKIDLSTGDILAEDMRAGSMTLSVSTGHVDLRNVSCSGDASVTVTTGKTRIEGLECRSFTSEGSTGDVTLKDAVASGKMIIERSTGDVKFDACDADELDVSTDTGEVKGTLLSDKVFIVRSDTGDVDVPETTSGGVCRISTDTGDIKIEIEK